MDQQIQASQDLLKVQSDIGLAQREYKKLLADLEKLQKTRTKTFQE